MKRLPKTPRSIVVALLAGGALLGAGNAFAQYAQDQPPPAYAQPHVMPVDVNVSIGWHGDRYWDGRRYWEHDEWMHHHPHERDPYRYHERDRDRERAPHGY